MRWGDTDSKLKLSANEIIHFCSKNILILVRCTFLLLTSLERSYESSLIEKQKQKKTKT